MYYIASHPGRCGGSPTSSRLLRYNHGRLAGTAAEQEPVIARLQRIFPHLREVSSDRKSTACLLSLPGYRGSAGGMEGESPGLCRNWSNVRIIPDGVLKKCRHDTGILELKIMLRSGAVTGSCETQWPLRSQRNTATAMMRSARRSCSAVNRCQRQEDEYGW